MNNQKPREIAINLLRQREGGGDFIENQLEQKLATLGLKPEDKRLLQEIVYGSIRWQSALDWLIQQKSKPQKQNPVVEILLRTALYQMFWLTKIPSYAAVNETIDMARKLGLEKQAGFINAVLRGYDREKDQTTIALQNLRKTSPAIGFSHPEWLVRKWEKRWPREKLAEMLEQNNKTPPTYARLNKLKSTEEELLAAWEKESVMAEKTSFDYAPTATVFKILSHPSFVELPSFKEGRFYIQDPSTLASVELMEPKGGEAILDLCAAPGGKTTFIAEKMGNSGQIVAEDIDSKRLNLVKENVTRMGIQNVRYASAAGEKFDRILIDAPCSNTGVLRRRVELRWRIKPEEVTRLADAQARLLDTAAQRLKPGGVLVYSTCSIEPEENQLLIERFLKSRNEFKLEKEVELTPLQGVDGAYAARLKHQG
ncbi:MAG: 16S rRNA (cytosine(967)-C(5))-methyltransferase RsmB [Verrucomicrobiales bacterium]